MKIDEVDGMTALKPCPFCESNNIDITKEHNWDNYGFCKCNDCESRGPDVRCSDNWQENASKFWNERWMV